MDKQAKILVTGGTGFIGSYILRYLVNAGYTNLHALKRTTSDLSLLGTAKENVAWIDCDLLDTVRLFEVIEGVDGVIHSAAMVSFDPSDSAMLMKVNVEGTANVVNACLESGVRRFIHVSSIASFARKKDGGLIDESVEWEDGKSITGYARSKYYAEMEAWRGGSEGLSMAMINPALVLGAGFWQQGSPSMFKQISDGMRFYPTGSTGFVDVRDVALAAIILLENDVQNQRFIISAENLTFKSVFDQIADGLNKSRPSIALNSFLNEVAFWVLKIRSLFTSQKPLTRATIKNSAALIGFNAEKSIQELGLNYRSVAKTIRETSALLSESVSESPGTLPSKYLSI